MTLDHECSCPVAGQCQRYGRVTSPAQHAACRGDDGDQARTYYRSLWDRLRRRRNGERVPPVVTIPPPDSAAVVEPRECVHIGPDTGEVRDCETCKGRVRQKVYGCAVFGTTTLRDCTRCPHYRRAPERVSGLDVGFHDGDHWAITLGKGATLALYDEAGRADRSWEGRWAGQTFYFLGGGPSLASVDLAALDGRPTIAANSVCEIYPRPTVWIGVDPPDDPPGRFRGVPWDDPAVLKLLPRAQAGADTGGAAACERPSTRFFLRNGLFRPWAFLGEPSANWGGDKPFGVGRSVMLPALRLLHYFGVRRVVLLGCDFHMDPARPYAHSAQKDERGCASNNAKFALLDKRFGMLRPYLEAGGMTVVNATEGSHLTAFDRVSLAEELAR